MEAVQQRPRVKICCIASVEEVRLAVQAGASAVGLVSEMPSGPGVLPWEAIPRVAASVPPGVATFLLTCSQDAAALIEQQKQNRVNTLQICDRLERGTYQDLRDALPGIALVQVIHVQGEESLREAVSLAPSVDALLLDSGNQTLTIKELGGTGRVHDWSISHRIREQVEVPVYLAGGLNAGNVGEAVRQVGPFGLDVCSGVRTKGALDPQKLAGFFAALEGSRREQAASGLAGDGEPRRSEVCYSVALAGAGGSAAAAAPVDLSTVMLMKAKHISSVVCSPKPTVRGGCDG